MLSSTRQAPSSVSQVQARESRSHGCRAEQAATERYRIPNGFKGVGIKLLGHQADGLPGFAVLLDDVVAGGLYLAIALVDDAADDRDQGGFTSTVGAEQREDLAGVDFQVDVFEGLEAIFVDLVQVLNGYVRLHGRVLFCWW